MHGWHSSHDVAGHCHSGEQAVDAFCGVPMSPSEDHCKMMGISCEALMEEITSKKKGLLIVDVRSTSEIEFCPFGNGSINIPFAMFADRIEEIKSLAVTSSSITIICRKGWNSFKATLFLRKYGLPTTTFLIGGLLKWAATVDKSFPIY